jgi:pimeloyl-ACP methyl ester carboxylesterase
MGLGAIKSAWQRQTHKFGHLEGDKYSVLVYDNRGIGESDKPLMRYSTSEMAEDALEVLGHVGWLGERELHVIGVSMGGMIAQELALKVPQRVASLALCSTAARVEQTIPFLEHLRNRISMFIPKSIDRAVQDAAFNLFPDTFLDAPEQIRLPTKESPNVEPPPVAGGWATGYGAWSTNFERFAATELTKRADKEAFTRKGFILQAIAAGWHNVSTERLKTLGDTVGRERIMVIHGTEDRMLTFPHGETLARELELREKGGEVHFLEGSGHVLMIEKNEWHDGVLAGLWERTENL